MEKFESWTDLDQKGQTYEHSVEKAQPEWTDRWRSFLLGQSYTKLYGERDQYKTEKTEFHQSQPGLNTPYELDNEEKLVSTVLMRNIKT